MKGETFYKDVKKKTKHAHLIPAGFLFIFYNNIINNIIVFFNLKLLHSSRGSSTNKKNKAHSDRHQFTVVDKVSLCETQTQPSSAMTSLLAIN